MTPQRSSHLSQYRRRARSLVVLVFALMAAGLQAAAPPTQTDSSTSVISTAAPGRVDPRFEIRRFVVEGATRVSPERVHAALAHLTGPGRRFSDIETALEAVRDVYVSQGITAIQVVIPEQTLEAGEVRLQVIELSLDKIALSGARYRSQDNIRRALPTLREGSTPVDQDLSLNLRLANENPSRQMQVTFRPGNNGELTGVVRIADRPAWSGQALLDNSGSRSTGQWRLAAEVQHTNAFDRDVVVAAQVQTSPGHEQDVKIGSASMRIPLYAQSLLLDTSVIRSSVDSGTVTTTAGEYLLASRGNSLSLRVTRLLPRLQAWDHRLTLGLDTRHVDSRVLTAAGGSSLIPDIILRPTTALYAGSWSEEGRTVTAQVSLSRNLPGGGRSAASVFSEPGLRLGANPRYTILRSGVSILLPWAGGSLTLQWNGQWSKDSLVAAEQFGVGGWGSVRGFNGRVASADVGQRLALEWLSPMRVIPSWPAVTTGWQGFAEAAQATRNAPLPGEIRRYALSGLGLGFRAVHQNGTGLRIDAGLSTRAAGLVEKGGGFIHASASHVF